MPEPDQPGSSTALSFALFDGGPFHRLQQQLGLVRAEQRRTGVRVLMAVLISWVPIAVLAVVQGLAIGPTRLESFLMDFAVNVRFLVTVPIFLLAEGSCMKQLRSIVRQFLDAGLVKDASRASFEAAVRDTVRLSHSGRAEAVLVGLAYLHTVVVLIYLLDYQDTTWRTPVMSGRHVISLAGVWYLVVAFPFYSFLLWRWLWRVGLWWKFLWQTSKLDLRLTPSHRDGAGGLVFLSESLQAFGGFVFGVMSMWAGALADFVVYEGHSLFDYQWQMVEILILVLILIAGPLLLFVRPLYEAKERGIFRYGALASRQIQHVEDTWLPEGMVRDDLESSMPDFRSVTHLGHSVTAVHKMSVIPINKEDILQLLIIALLPFVPVLLTQIPLAEILSLLLKVLA